MTIITHIEPDLGNSFKKTFDDAKYYIARKRTKYEDYIVKFIFNGVSLTVYSFSNYEDLYDLYLNNIDI